MEKQDLTFCSIRKKSIPFGYDMYHLLFWNLEFTLSIYLSVLFLRPGRAAAHPSLPNCFLRFYPWGVAGSPVLFDDIYFKIPSGGTTSWTQKKLFDCRDADRSPHSFYGNQQERQQQYQYCRASGGG